MTAHSEDRRHTPAACGASAARLASPWRPDRSRLRPENVPEPVLAIADSLRAAGGEAWLVGGAVRDLVLDRPVNDWDLATNLLPETVRRLFPRTIDVGIRFGTVLVLRGGMGCEVTTFRQESLYSDARHPDEVRFTRTLEDDLVRRDFTVNALAYGPADDRLADPTGGMGDLARGILRAVGNPAERFGEDALRLLRAVRLSAQLGFDLEAATYAALVLGAPGISRISAERIREEFDRLITSPHPASALALLHECGLLRRILPELAAAYGVPQNPHHAFDVFHHTLAAVAASPPEDRLVRLAVLFHDVGKPETRVEKGGTATFYGHQFAGARMARQAMRRLRYSNEERSAVSHLVHHHMFHYRPEWTDAAVRRFLREVGRENLDRLFALRGADTMGNGLRRRIAPELAELRARIEREVERESALSLRDLAVHGREIMEAVGIPPGPEVGRILHALLEMVLEDPESNRRETLLDRATELHRDAGPNSETAD